MPTVTDRITVTKALAEFQTRPLKDAARRLLDALGYRSDRSLAGSDSSPRSFIELFPASGFDQEKALISEWKTADLLFQLTDQELSRESSLFTDNSVKAGLLKSYVFIAIELKGGDYARGKFSAIVRQINRIFPMPVMVFFKHQGSLTIAVINRRMNKRDENRDVLGKVTLIREIDFAQPHRGHLDILASLALPNLVHPQKKPITDFDTLHAAWEQIFNVELLNERFYRELANWYFWALPQVEFPADLEPDDEKRRATGLIRLLTRLIFCWFLKEKSLIPEKLFHPTDLAKLLKGFDPESKSSSTYYQAILQNLFFATLNQRMGKDAKGQPYRVFAKDDGWQKNRATYDVNNLYRYEKLFAVPEDEALAQFADIPFLNGGLFECLDRTEESSPDNPVGESSGNRDTIVPATFKKRYLDGFSRNPKKRPTVPDRLFFDSGETADLSAAYGDTKRKKEPVTGLIHILNRYKFTIVENTPIDQEIALDPELLGKVFENLLASYNEETKTTARKQTGSFYTPRPIVDYMVDESLKAHLEQKVAQTILSGVSKASSSDISRKHRNLPHWTKDGSTYWITFRLADSLPQEKLTGWKAERDAWVRLHPEPWDDEQWKDYDERFGQRLESWLDAGSGECILRRPDVRAIVEKCLLHFDGQRYETIDWVIMPNHVHLLLRPQDGQSLSKILQGIKGVSAKECNAVLGRTGQTFWQEESYDHIVRSQAQLDHFIRYVADNPVKAKLKDGEFSVAQRSTDNLVRDSSEESQTIEDQTGLSGLRSRLDLLFAYTEREHAFTPAEVATLIAAIDALKVLDPACGSGAFPMGVLHKLVYILGKLDPDNERWKQTQLAKLDSAPMREQLEAAFADNPDDYGRKLYLIENCLYGVDIQPIAIQITKLRFFISLVCDQKTNRNKKDNHGIRPLPNLETKFVAADTLIGLPIPEPDLFVKALIEPIEKEIEAAYHSHFAIQRREQKLALQKKIKSLRQKLADTLVNELGAKKNSEITKKAQHVADWDPFDPQASADFFDPHWMFGRSVGGGFDIVVGNPPYLSVEKFARTALQAKWKDTFKTFSARGDIYCLFYERGFDLVRKGGILAYITSNKFQRAGYGKALRQLLSSQRINILIDFCELPVFAAAADPIIVIAVKTDALASRTFPVLVVKDEAEFSVLAASVATRASAYTAKQLNVEGWSLESSDGHALMGKLQTKGTPLIEYVNRGLYRGIITGLNEAFVIDRDTRASLIREDSKSAELIKPWIRGRDITRWTHEFHELYIILVRFGFHAELKNYPAVLWHLTQFEEKLKARGQCNTSRSGSSEGQHHWLELDNNPLPEYLNHFSKPSVVYADIGKRLKAFHSTEGIHFGNTAYFIPNAEPWLAAVLLSTPLDFCYRHVMQPLGDPWTSGRMRFFSRSMNQVPIPPASASDKAKLTKLAEQAARSATAGDNAAVAKIEREIDEIVYRLFELNAEEIAHIENALKNTRSPSSEDDDDESE